MDAEDSDQLWTIATGMLLPEEATKDLLEARLTGEKLFNEFVQERLINKTKDFFSPIHKYKLQTCEILFKPVIVSEGKKKNDSKK